MPNLTEEDLLKLAGALQDKPGLYESFLAYLFSTGQQIPYSHQPIGLLTPQVPYAARSGTYPTADEVTLRLLSLKEPQSPPLLISEPGYARLRIFNDPITLEDHLKTLSGINEAYNAILKVETLRNVLSIYIEEKTFDATIVEPDPTELSKQIRGIGITGDTALRIKTSRYNSWGYTEIKGLVEVILPLKGMYSKTLTFVKDTVGGTSDRMERWAKFFIDLPYHKRHKEVEARSAELDLKMKELDYAEKFSKFLKEHELDRPAYLALIGEETETAKDAIKELALSKDAPVIEVVPQQE